MYILTVTYPKSGDASFDFDYFRSKPTNYRTASRADPA